MKFLLLVMLTYYHVSVPYETEDECNAAAAKLQGRVNAVVVCIPAKEFITLSPTTNN